MMRLSRLPCLALAAACLGAAGNGIDATKAVEWRPVPAEWFEGRTLVVQKDQFRIDTPGEGWVWRHAEKPTEDGSRTFRTYECRSPSSESRAFSVAAVDPGADYSAKDLMKIAGETKGEFGRRSAFVERHEFGTSDVPLPGTVSLRYDLRLKGGTLQATGTLLVSGRRLYEIRWDDLRRSGPRPEEPGEFKAFVASFRQLRRDRSVPIPPGPAVWHFRVLGFWCVVAVLWNFLTTAPRMNPGWMAAFHIAVSAWLWAFFERSAAFREGAQPDELARVSSLGFHSALLPFAFALGVLVVFRLFRRSPASALPEPEGDDGREGRNG